MCVCFFPILDLPGFTRVSVPLPAVMSNANCCVPGCYNTSYKTRDRIPKLHFYRFPSKPYDAKRKAAWVRFVSRINPDGTPWEPTKHSLVCSAHFVGEKQVNHPLHPSFAPTIRPGEKPKKGAAARFERMIQRNTAIYNKANPPAGPKITVVHPKGAKYSPSIDLPETETTETTKNAGTNTLFYWRLKDNKGRLNLFLSHTNGTEASTQVDHEPEPVPPPPIVPFGGGRGTLFPLGTKRNASVGTDLNVPTFYGYETVMQKGNLVELTSVPPEVFHKLLDLLQDFKARTLRTEDLLLMFLVQLKLGLPFTTLAIFFSSHASTLRSNYNKILEILYEKTQEFVYWPSEEEVEDTMPEGIAYSSSCRVILHAMELKSESRDDGSVKVLIGLTPNGRISFLSPTFDGRQSHNYINHSATLRAHLLPSDTVVSLRDLPWIGTAVVYPAKSPIIRKPVRIYAENIVNRMKAFKVLTNFTSNLLPQADAIVHIVAVLVNLRTSLKVKEKKLGELVDVEVGIINEEEHSYSKPSSTSESSSSVVVVDSD